MALSFISMNAKTAERRIHIKLKSNKTWEQLHKSSYVIPIEATIIDENYIIIEFLQENELTVTFQIEDNQGNTIYHDITIPDIQEPYCIDLSGVAVGQYELIYSDGQTELSGKFDVE